MCIHSPHIYSGIFTVSNSNIDKITNALVGIIEPFLGGLVCEIMSQFAETDPTTPTGAPQKGFLSEKLDAFYLEVGNLDLLPDPILQDEEDAMVAGLTTGQLLDTYDFSNSAIFEGTFFHFTCTS